MKFSHKIISTSSVLLLFTIVLLSTRQFLTMRAEMQHIINDSISDIVNGVGNTVAIELENKKNAARFITAQIEQNPSYESITKLIKEQNGFSLIGGQTTRDDRVFTSDSEYWTPAAKYDPSVRPWYQAAKNQNQLIITDPYVVTDTHETLVSIATPIHLGGQFSGAVFFDLSLKSLADLVNNVEMFDAGYLFIVTETGTVIAHPDIEMNGQSMDAFLPSIQIGENSKQQVTLSGGKEYELYFKKVSGQNWYIGTLLDESIAYQSIYNMRNDSIIYSVVAVIVSVFLLKYLISYLMAPLRELDSAIQGVASGNGDLTKRLNTNTDPEFAGLAGGFNTFTENLQGQITQLKGIGDKIMNGTSVTAKGASTTALAMAEQLKELEQLATAMHEMSMTSSDVATNAQTAAVVAKEANDATLQGTDVVTQTSDSINDLSLHIDLAVERLQTLESATNSIATVLQVINDIAEQTNLLALNAAIEAARAGDHGRGFAVVADEVRTLAQRTQASTTEIKSMIEQLQTGASGVASAMNQSKKSAFSSVEKSQAANEALQRIFDAIKHISDMNLQIASAAEEQSLVAEEINTNTMKIRGLSVQVSGEADQTNKEMKVQTGNVREQNDVLEKFIV